MAGLKETEIMTYKNPDALVSVDWLAADLDAPEELATESETFRLVDRIFFLHAPDGVGRSKLVAKLGKHLGVAMTARNANTVGEIAKLCEEKPTKWR